MKRSLPVLAVLSLLLSGCSLSIRSEPSEPSPSPTGVSLSTLSALDDLPPRASRSRSYVAPAPSRSPQVVRPPVRKVTTPSPRPKRTATRQVVTSHTLGGDFARLRQCESGGNYAINTGNGYYGAYQFDVRTWRGLGFSGYPHQASPATQDRAARVLHSQRGWQPWPACSRKLGLR